MANFGHFGPVGMDQSGTHPLESRLRLAEVMSGLFPAERVILGAPEASKLAKWPILTILPRLTLS